MATKDLVRELISTDIDSTLTLEEIGGRVGVSKQRVQQIISEEHIKWSAQIRVSNKPKCSECDKLIRHYNKTGMCRDCKKRLNTVSRRCEICHKKFSVTKKSLETAKISGIASGIFCGRPCSAENMRRKRGY